MSNHSGVSDVVFFYLKESDTIYIYELRIDWKNSAPKNTNKTKSSLFLSTLSQGIDSIFK